MTENTPKKESTSNVIDKTAFFQELQTLNKIKRQNQSANVGLWWSLKKDK